MGFKGGENYLPGLSRRIQCLRHHPKGMLEKMVRVPRSQELLMSQTLQFLQDRGAVPRSRLYSSLHLFSSSRATAIPLCDEASTALGTSSRKARAAKGGRTEHGSHVSTNCSK